MDLEIPEQQENISLKSVSLAQKKKKKLASQKHIFYLSYPKIKFMIGG
jgi:hypothetical protein